VFFVMAAPSVWRSAGVDSRLGLEALMTAVWVHEMTHVFQFETYGRRIDALAAKWGFGDDLTDDVVQDRFESQTEFARAHASEVELLYRAAAARSDAEASQLAREALAAARSRQERWLADEDARYRELESVFLTLEGSGNWAAFSWLVAAEGGGIAHEAALAEFGRRGGRWTQDEGTAIFMVIDRLVDDWTSRVFGPDAPTAFELLEEATKAAAIPD
jgi:hypothetical protein